MRRHLAETTLPSRERVLRVAVVGAGVVGVTTAYELMQDGHEVTVFERCSTAAEGASFANAGLLAPEWMAARASLDWQNTQKSGLSNWWKGFRRHRLPTHGDPGPGIFALAQYGAERLAALCERLQMAVDSHQGMMAVWRDARDSAMAEDLHARMRAIGGECHLMPAEQARALELALNSETPLQGSLVMPDVWSVNCRQFTLLLRARAQQDGCQFAFGRAVTALAPGHPVRVTHGTHGETDPFDTVVLCAGAATDALLRPMGVDIPLEDWNGHSLSASVREAIDAPVAVVHDLRHGVSIARMAQRVRVSGPLSRAGKAERPEDSFKRLYKVLDDWFPGAIRLGQTGGTQEWSTQVNTSPDGLPVIGETAAPRIWINSGHGMHGWVMACASARLLADQIGGQASEIDGSPYSALRWSQ